jgi:hypothetical protein
MDGKLRFVVLSSARYSATLVSAIEIVSLTESNNQYDRAISFVCSAEKL